jgi:hypothetical protein
VAALGFILMANRRRGLERGFRFLFYFVWRAFVRNSWGILSDGKAGFNNILLKANELARAHQHRRGPDSAQSLARLIFMKKSRIPAGPE